MRAPDNSSGGGKRIAGRKQRVEPGFQVAQPRVAETGAHISGVLQFTFLIVHTQQQRPDAGAGTLGVGKAANHELLPLAAFEFYPVRRAPRLVGGVPAFCDDTFQAQRAGRTKHALRRCVEHVAELDLVRLEPREKFL